jgi:inosine triphosphate pyrophosphatase
VVTFTIVTGNQNKLAEFHRLIPKNVDFDSVSIDLEEIQSLDSKRIVEHKVQEAYKIVGKPVIVEDVSASLLALNGLPGPFIKFFEQQLGSNALYRLVRDDSDKRAVITCTIGYYDGTTLLFGTGLIEGTVVSARGETGFGFDFCFVPNSENRTFAEMLRPEKDAISHRSLAVADLLSQLAT